MIAIKILDMKDFTNKLFVGTVFDKFWLVEASITTFNTFHIHGKLQKDFFETDEKAILDENKRSFSLWKEIKPYCHNIIRGKRTPLQFKIVFQFSPNRIASMLGTSDLGLRPENINGLYLNLQYKNKTLLCTTGVSINTFSTDKRLEQFWDSQVLDFFHQNQLLFEHI